MTDPQRLSDLRRRIQKDPASIAFGHLAEELRRAGQFQEAVDVCQAGLEVHPGYLSARVTLGRALLSLNRLDDAQHALEQARTSAPENLAAIRGLAEVYQRRGELEQALAHYRAALELSGNNPDLELMIAELSQISKFPASPDSDGDPSRAHAARTIAALEQWLDQVHVARAERRA